MCQNFVIFFVSCKQNSSRFCFQTWCSKRDNSSSICIFQINPHTLQLYDEIFQGYVWLKDKILSEDGRRQQAKLREAAVIADRIGCSITQLAIGKEKKLFVITFPFIKGWYHKISKNRCNYFFIEFLRNKLQLNLSDISFKSSLGNQNITCPFHQQSLNWCCFV